MEPTAKNDCSAKQTLQQTNCDERLLTSLPIPPATLGKLNKAGLTVVRDLLHFRPSELSSCCEMTVEEAADVLDLVRGNQRAVHLESALELLMAERRVPCIVTMSARIDSLLGGGVPVGKITEIAGIAGVGKTQLCLQLCVNVQIPSECSGLQSRAVFIDTEGSFNVARLQDMSEACIKHCRSHMKMKAEWSVASIIDNVYVFRCRELTELISCVMVLKEFLVTHRQVKLVVIDSLAFHFRHDLDNAALRSRVLHKLASHLSHLAVCNGLAVVVTNQMTTKFTNDGRTGISTPALGASWGHAPSCRVLLNWDPSHSLRWFTLIKAAHLPPGSAPYQVTADGIRDVVTDVDLTAPRIVYEDGIVGTSFEGGSEETLQPA